MNVSIPNFAFLLFFKFVCFLPIIIVLVNNEDLNIPQLCYGSLFHFLWSPSNLWWHNSSWSFVIISMTFLPDKFINFKVLYQLIPGVLSIYLSTPSTLIMTCLCRTHRCNGERKMHRYAIIINSSDRYNRDKVRT